MNGITHMVIGGLTGGLCVAIGLSQHSLTIDIGNFKIYTIATIASGMIGGLAPDVDMPRSIAGKFMRNTLRIFLVASAILLALVYLSPDIGIAFSGKTITIGSTIDKVYLIILAIICVCLLIIIEKSSHRGLTHTGIMLLALASPMVYMFMNNVTFDGSNMVFSLQLGFILGWLSHLIIDTFNYPGTPWLWPLVDNHFNIARVDSGTGQETAFRAICVVAFSVAYGMIILN